VSPSAAPLALVAAARDAAAAETSAPVPRFVGPGYITAFVAVTLAGFSQAATTPDAFVSRSALAWLAVACTLYTLLGTLALYVAERRGTRRHVHLVIGALCALGVVTTFASHGYTSMLLLAVVSVGVLYLRARGSLLVTAIGSLTALIAFAMRDTLWGAFWQAEIAFGSGIAFVFVFSRVALREQQARGQLERLATELAGANERLIAQAGHVEQLAKAKERNRIAREIHDGLGHYLTVVHVQLEAARTYLSSDPERACAAIMKSQQLTHEGLCDVRRSVSLLRGSAPGRPPLIDALTELTDASTAAGVATSMRVEGAPRRLAEPIEFTLFRATQEALTNARRHAHASRVGIVLAFTESASVRLRVEDDGQGASHPSDGFGLLGMRERDELVGGTLAITTTHNQGFAIELEVPG
jgi:signal transduction histidine kinase